MTNSKLLVNIIVLFILVITIGGLLATTNHSKTRVTEKATRISLSPITGLFNVETTIYPKERPNSVAIEKITDGFNIKYSIENDSVKVVIYPETINKSASGVAELKIYTSKRTYVYTIPFKIIIPKYRVELVGFDGAKYINGFLELYNRTFGVKLRIIPEDHIGLKILNATGNKIVGVRTLSNNTIEIIYDSGLTADNDVMGKINLEAVISVEVTSDKGIDYGSVSLQWEKSFFYEKLYSEGIPLHPVKIISKPIMYQDPKSGGYIYAFKVINTAKSDLMLSTNGNCLTTYPMFYGVFPECWKAILYSVYQQTIGVFSGSKGSSGCALEICSKEYLVHGGNVPSSVYIYSKKPLSNVVLNVTDRNGLVIQTINIPVSNFTTSEYFPTFGVSQLFEKVMSRVPFLMSTSADGSAFSPIYSQMVSRLIQSPFPDEVVYHLKVYAITNESTYGYYARVIVPQLNFTKTVALTPVASIDGRYVVLSTEVNIEGDKLGMIPAYVILFHNNRPLVLEKTMLTIRELESKLTIPTASIGGRAYPIDFNALEIVKFWGYAMNLFNSNETVLDKGGYISKSDGTITLRLEVAKLINDGKYYVPETKYIPLYNITQALEIMFFGDLGTLNTVGMYVSDSNTTPKPGQEINTIPLSYTLQPKYVSYKQILENPTKYVRILELPSGKKVNIAVFNPTPYTVTVTSRGKVFSIKPFEFKSFSEVDSISIVTEGKVLNVKLNRTSIEPLPLGFNDLIVNNSAGLPVMNQTIVEIPLSKGLVSTSITNVSVIADGKKYVAEFSSPSSAILVLKEALNGVKTKDVKYYFTVFNDRAVMNIVVPFKASKELRIVIDTNNGSIEFGYTGKNLLTLYKAGFYDVAPIPNFNEYIILSHQPVFFEPIPKG